MKFHAHKMVREVAKGMANEAYEAIMRDNSNYKQWKEMCPDLTPELAREKFVELLYPRMLEQARHTLASMLTGNYPDVLKEQIHDALVKDNLFKEGRQRAIAASYGLH